MQGKYGEEKLSVINDWSLPDRETPALLLVDGVPVFDQGKFIKINNRLISSTQIAIAPSALAHIWKSNEASKAR